MRIPDRAAIVRLRGPEAVMQLNDCPCFISAHSTAAVALAGAESKRRKSGACSQAVLKQIESTGTALALSVLALALLVGCGGIATAQSSSSTTALPVPGSTTTLQAETANNTSASSSFTAQLNGLPAPGNVSKIDTHTLLYSGSTTKVFAGMEGWFGEAGHMNVGYNSNNPQQVHLQVQDMISRGMQGAILDWYGLTDPVVNGTAQALRTEAEANPGFEFAIMEDGGALFDAAVANGCDVTTQVLSDLNYINSQYASSSAYMRVDGRPVVFFFGVDAFYIDWAQVRAQVPGNPIFLYRGTDGLTRTISDGGFQWEDVPGDPFSPASLNPFDPLLAAQAAFYSTATKTSGRLAVGSVYKGFNDSLAPWGINRFVVPNCGQTWLATFNEIGSFYSSTNQLPALQIVTWNDYDEGTAVEMGIDNCAYVVPAVSGNNLTWTLGGAQENTIDHYTVYSSTNGQNLTVLANVPSGTHSLSLAPFNLTSGDFTLYVKATGRPTIQNKISPAIVFRAGDQPPVARVAASLTGPLTVTASTEASTGSIASSSINFGDGTIVPGPTATHAYKNVGTYNVSGTVADALGASSVATQQISAKAVTPGVTIFSPTPSQVVNWPMPAFVASATSPNPITRMNLLVDGTQQYAINQDTINTALKVYTGNHHLVVQAFDSTGAQFAGDVDITAEPNEVPPIPGFQVTALPQVAPNTELLCGAGWHAPNRFVNGYQWTFPNGIPTAFIPGVVQTFPGPGTFSVTQTVINEFGAVGTTTQNVNVSSTAATASRTTVHVQDEKTQKQSMPMRLPPQ
jgi:hypothetical protein